ncbi:MAG: hypothetical protein ACR2QV_12735 [Gammaproteobacteria bacterium]
MARYLSLVFLLLACLAAVAIAQQSGDAETGAEQEAGEDAGTSPTTVIDELTQAEIDAELAKAEKVLEDPDDVKEYIEDKPLPADLPLAIPSDF